MTMVRNTILKHVLMSRYDTRAPSPPLPGDQGYRAGKEATCGISNPEKNKKWARLLSCPRSPEHQKTVRSSNNLAERKKGGGDCSTLCGTLDSREERRNYCSPPFLGFPSFLPPSWRDWFLGPSIKKSREKDQRWKIKSRCFCAQRRGNQTPADTTTIEEKLGYPPQIVIIRLSFGFKDCKALGQRARA